MEPSHDHSATETHRLSTTRNIIGLEDKITTLPFSMFPHDNIVHESNANFWTETDNLLAELSQDYPADFPKGSKHDSDEAFGPISLKDVTSSEDISTNWGFSETGEVTTASSSSSAPVTSHPAAVYENQLPTHVEPLAAEHDNAPTGHKGRKASVEDLTWKSYGEVTASSEDSVTSPGLDNSLVEALMQRLDNLTRKLEDIKRKTSDGKFLNDNSPEKLCLNLFSYKFY
jgi:hypothetical protein